MDGRLPTRDECVDAAAEVLAQIWMDLPDDEKRAIIADARADAARSMGRAS